jgi:DNA-binding CsgD family transcriptional regulator
VKQDLVGVIDAAYSAVVDDAAWVQSVAEAAAPCLDQGLGILVSLYDTTTGRIVLDPIRDVGVGREGVDIIRVSHEAADPAVLRIVYRNGPHCSSARQRLRWTLKEYMSSPPIVAGLAQGRKFLDSVGVCSGDPSGIGCLIMAPMPGMTSAPVPQELRGVWTLIAAHLAAAVRLRRAAKTADAADAVLSASGRVEHAEGQARSNDARAALTRGAKRIDRAKGPLRRRDPRDAVALWRALVAGRWSLTEHFDHDGKRFLLAKRNPSSALPIMEVSHLERQVLALAILGHSNKLIAYQLGLTPSAAAMRLSRLARKLGARTRVELIEKCRGPGLRLADRQ